MKKDSLAALFRSGQRLADVHQQDRLPVSIAGNSLPPQEDSVKAPEVQETAMTGQRQQDQSDTRSHFRSERFTLINGQYFFTTREGTLEGPFFSRQDAERAVNHYLDRHQAAQAISASHLQP
jgi:hypothetical protein